MKAPLTIQADDLSPDGAWYTDAWSEGLLLSLRVKAVLRSEWTGLQALKVLETTELGRVLVLDDAIQTAEGDEAGYHELLVHPGLCREGAPASQARRVLVIGGGDGGAAREALRHPDVARVDLVDIDPAVTRAARELLPTLWRAPGGGPLDSDPRLHLHHQDGLAFLLEGGEPYDLVVVDATDPVGPGSVLFSDPFYAAVRGRLGEGGVCAAQAGSWRFAPEVLRAVHGGLARALGRAEAYQCTTALYPGGQWNLVLGTLGEDPRKADPRRVSALGRLDWYDAATHRAAFDLPPAARRLLGA